MRINVTSVFVDDQAKALDFYTDVLGFVKKTDVPAGEHRWLTVVSPEAPDGVELLLGPNAHPAAQAYQEALVADGVLATSFAVDDVQAEFDRLTAKGVTFVPSSTWAPRLEFAVVDRHSLHRAARLGAGRALAARSAIRDPEPPKITNAAVTATAPRLARRFGRCGNTRDRKIIAIGTSRNTAAYDATPSRRGSVGSMGAWAD